MYKRQLLERSFEYGEHPGLGLIPGEVRPIRDVIPAGLAVPHMGWNALRFPAERPRSPIFAALEEGEHVYFVHSYAGFACGEGLTAWTEYGEMCIRDRISACLLCNMQICGITILTSPLGQCSLPDSILITPGAKRSQISDFGYAN